MWVCECVINRDGGAVKRTKRSLNVRVEQIYSSVPSALKLLLMTYYENNKDTAQMTTHNVFIYNDPTV